MNSLRQKYLEEIIPQLKEELKLENSLATPRLKKITVSVSSSEFKSDKNLLSSTIDWLSAITGQKPKTTLAKQSIAGFNLREKDAVGLQVSLRGERMYDFLQKLTTVVFPRVKDFQGISLTAFDGQGNYSLGLTEQIVFPEVNYDKISKVSGLNISLTTSAKKDEPAKLLLQKLGLPFVKIEANKK